MPLKWGSLQGTEFFTLAALNNTRNQWLSASEVERFSPRRSTAAVLCKSKGCMVLAYKKIRSLWSTRMALVAAARAGGGILLIDSLMVADELADGDLVMVLPEYSFRAGQPIYLVYPARSWLAYKTSVFIAFLQERLRLQSVGLAKLLTVPTHPPGDRA